MADPLRLPVFAAPMFLVSGPELVIAACKAGIVGAFPTPNCRSIEQLDDWMTRIRAEVGEAPWCANLVTHSSNARLPQDLEMIDKHKPPFVVTALGSPKPAIETVHAYGGKVIADVTSVALARKAVAAGADGLACICAGAGGHTGMLSPFAFVSAVRAFFDGLVIVGGGITDGAGIAGAIAAGADYVYMGTRFIAAEESMAPAAYKDMLAAAQIEDLLISAGITGTPASWLKPSLRDNGMDPDDMPDAPGRAYDSSQSLKGKRWADVWSAGQGVGAVTGTEPASAIVARLEAEYDAARGRLSSRLDRSVA
ncbi:nitronate monooxygenase [Rhodobacter sp. NTK016B]|uniref:NAD(P)H-dependent flavin oxidoreductase n=1 Tax=Rhodobacter sp. NTK016B TaxID=2759676 RepID=UPI001A8F7376|nr:nitronate monooxygenase [Rhodobacter sp. NTK016B]MBN8292071.1 nitronate monooxygenase [Rhodobacter sp. NTK016B]